MSDILAAIDGALDAYDHAAADVTGNPWPGRVPSLDEMLEAVFGPEDGGPVPYPRDMHRTGDDAVVFRHYSRDERVEPTWGDGRYFMAGGSAGTPYGPLAGADWPQDPRERAVLESIRRSSPPDLSAFRLITGTGA